MGRPPIRHRDEAIAVVYTRVPGWLKNEIAKAAKKEKLSVNRFVANHLLEIIQSQKGLQAPVPIPSPQEELEAALTGLPLLQPCGEITPCPRTGEFDVDSFVYCETCRIRIR